MSSIRGKGGIPLNSDAWAEDHSLAVAKASDMRTNKRATKEDQAAADKNVLDTMAGYQKALADEKKKQGGQPPNTAATSSLFGGLFGQ
jgi:hypothetical protein